MAASARRRRRQRDPPRRTDSGTSWILPLALALIVLVCLGALALHLMRPVRRQRRMRGEHTQWHRGPDVPSELDKATRASLDALGERVTSLLRTAEDAAEEIRQTANQEAEEVRAQAERYSSETRRRADRVLRAAKERAERIEKSAVEHRRRVVAETKAMQEMLGAFRDVPGRLEGVDEGSTESDASAALPGQGVDGKTQLDDELRRQAHESAENTERAKDEADDEAEDTKERR